MTSRSTVALLFVTLLLPACYRYSEASDASPGTEVRTRLSNEAAIRRSEGTGVPVTSYDGRLVSADARTVRIDVLVARDDNQFRRVEIRDTIDIPRSEVVALEVREIDTARSLLFGAAVTAGAIALVGGFRSIYGGGEAEPTPPGNPTMRLSLRDIAAAALAVGLRVPFAPSGR